MSGNDKAVARPGYHGYETMRSALSEIFENLGGKYQINFA